MTNGSSKPQIDITMTAVLRPDLLEGTLKSIIKYVVDDINRFRLILNIDPIGEKVKPAKIPKVARKYFPNIIYNIASEPSFPKAVKWVWSKATAPYIFHWEDDVDILRKIDINKMVQILDNYSKISSLRLFKHNTPKTKKMKTFSCNWVYNEEGFYLANDWKRQFGLNPILIKRQFIKEALPNMVDNDNPEKQFRVSKKYMAPVIKRWKYAIYTKPGELRIINGIKGQGWKNKMGLQKPKGKLFLKWEK